jgi:hypothetical protein
VNLPASLDAERAVLGAVIIEGSAGFRKLSLRAEHFYVEHNRDVFTAAQRLDGRGDPIDLLTITEELRRMGALDRIGGQGYVALLVEQASILVHLPSYEKIVVEEATRRAYLALGERLRYGATNGTGADELAAMADAVLAAHRRGARRRSDDVPTELTRLLEHRFPPRAEIIGHGILPRRSLMVLGGRSFVGKSLLADNAIAQRARGLPWLTHPTDPGASLICSCEIPPAAAAERFRTMLHDEPEPVPQDRVHVRTERGIKLDTADGLATISSWIEETGATLVRFDPLARYMSSEENSTRDMGRVVDALERMADRYDLGVIVVHHVGHAQKDSARVGGDRLRGASALFAAADSVGMLDKDGDGYRLAWELRHARAPEPMRLTRTEALWYQAAGLSDEDQAVAKIVAVISLTHTGLVGAIVEDCRVSKSTAKRRVTDALASKAIQKGDDGRYHAGPSYTAEGSKVHEGSLGDWTFAYLLTDKA